MIKFGFNRQGNRRFRCKQCGKTFSDIPARALDDLRIEPEKAYQAIAMLAEGVGVRAIERLLRLNRRTVLSLVELAGVKCERLLDQWVRGVRATEVQTDEIYSFVRTLQYYADKNNPEEGEQWIFLAVDRYSKLIISHLVGKRTKMNANDFMADLRSRLANRVHLSTDGFPGYSSSAGAVGLAFGNDVDYGIEIKSYGSAPGADPFTERFNPQIVKSLRRRPIIGNPDMSRTMTNHVERTNLSFRLFTRRLTRKTICYSKKLLNHKRAIALTVAHFNFCRVHSAHKQTPAMAAGLTDHIWTVAELLSA